VAERSKSARQKPSEPAAFGEVYEVKGKKPKIHESVLLAPGSRVVGDVEIGEASSLWFNTVIRGDVERVVVGKRTNIQDLAMIHVTHGRYTCLIGDDVTVGHQAILHGCRILGRVLIGMGAVVLDDVEVGEDSIVAAHSLVRVGFKVPPRTLVAGVPAMVKRDLKPEEIEEIARSAERYAGYAQEYRTTLRLA
jgi:carbonic anhydrase/acetyltransferase-like protein (isoleucine patch superfamily)